LGNVTTAGLIRDYGNNGCLVDQEFPGNAVHGVDGDLPDGLDVVIGGVAPLHGEGLGPCRREARNTVLPELCVCDFVALGRLDQTFRDSVLPVPHEDPLHLRDQRTAVRTPRESRHRVSGCGLRQDAAIEVDGQGFPFRNQGVEFPPPAVQHVLENLPCGVIGAVVPRHPVGDYGQSVRQVGVENDGGRSRRREANVRARGEGTGRYRPEQALHSRKSAARVHVPGDDQDGIVRRIPLLVEFPKHRPGRLPEGGTRPERILGVRRSREHVPEKLLIEKVFGIGQVLGDLLFDRPPLFLPERFRGQNALHADRLDAQRDLQVFRRHGEIILRDGLLGIRVEIPSESGNDRGQLIRGKAPAAAEHHMLQGMGRPREPFGSLVRPDPIIDLRRHHRREGVPNDDHPKAVGERLAEDVRSHRPRRENRGQEKEGHPRGDSHSSSSRTVRREEPRGGFGFPPNKDRPLP
jgi:hypothetical protein